VLKRKKASVDISTLDGNTKAAILLACLGPSAASRVLSQLDDSEIERLTLDLASLGSIESETREAVIEEFHQMIMSSRGA